MEQERKLTTFEELNNINLNDKTKSKIGLTYLSWAYAWGEIKKHFPGDRSSWTVYTRTVKFSESKTTHDDITGGDTTITTEYENEVPYFTDGKTCYVKVGVTIDGREEIERLAVMDHKNNAVSLASVSMTNVMNSIQRCFVKACARHGLGLYIYAGEDLPDAEKVVINYDEIAKNCDRFATTVLTQEGFDTLKNNVIKQVQLIEAQDSNWPKEAKIACTSYIAKEAKGTRLSQFTLEGHGAALQRIDFYMNEVKKQLAANAK